VEQFATEEQQVEAIKRFWKENGIAIIVGAVIGLGGLWGWQYYSDSQLAAKEAASQGYQEVVENLQADDGIVRAEAFLANHQSSGYAAMTALVLAAQEVENNNLEAALGHLQTAVQSKDGSLQNVAKMRLARVQLAMNEAQAALDSVAKIDAEAFTAQVEEIKGDAYVMLADFTNARLAYSAAVEADSANRIVKMKLDNLAITAGI
jgi:predicted negative regulator of RcsB-dependent stress response